MSLYNSLITKLRASSLIVNVQSCLRGRRVYEWKVRSGMWFMWRRTWWEFSILTANLYTFQRFSRTQKMCT